eukprot:4810518-Prymnesium_polylepis.1
MGANFGASHMRSLLPSTAAAVTALAGSRTGEIAVGYSSGRIVLLRDVHNDDDGGTTSAAAAADGHAGGTLALAFAECGAAAESESALVLASAGADGRVCVWREELVAPLRSHAVPSAGATTGPHGAVLDTLAAEESDASEAR